VDPQAPPAEGPADPATPPEDPADPATPSNEFQLGPVRLDRRHGAATVTATLPGPGALELAASKRVRGLRTSVAERGPSRLAVVPTKATKSRLRRSGKATVQLAVTFTPAGGTPRTERATVGLRKRPQA
jgi:hypothetical protein